MPSRLTHPSAQTASRTEADVEQIFGLVNLHRVPDVQSAEIPSDIHRNRAGGNRALQCPVGAGPGAIEMFADRLAEDAEGAASRRLSPMSSGRFPRQRVDRRQHDQNQNAIAVQAFASRSARS